MGIFDAIQCNKSHHISRACFSASAEFPHPTRNSRCFDAFVCYFFIFCFSSCTTMVTSVVNSHCSRLSRAKWWWHSRIGDSPRYCNWVEFLYQNDETMFKTIYFLNNISNIKKIVQTSTGQHLNTVIPDNNLKYNLNQMGNDSSVT